jgi:hypothetical protein
MLSLHLALYPLLCAVHAIFAFCSLSSSLCCACYLCIWLSILFSVLCMLSLHFALYPLLCAVHAIFAFCSLSSSLCCACYLCIWLSILFSVLCMLSLHFALYPLLCAVHAIFEFGSLSSSLCCACYLCILLSILFSVLCMLSLHFALFHPLSLKSLVFLLPSSSLPLYSLFSLALYPLLCAVHAFFASSALYSELSDFFAFGSISSALCCIRLESDCKATARRLCSKCAAIAS